MRTETFGAVTLVLGDCSDYLQTSPVFDLCLTDPPYGIGADKAASKNGGKWGWTYYGETDWDSERPQKEVFDLIMAKSKTQIIWGGNYFTDYLPPSMQWLVWDKGQRDFSLADCEFAWTSQNKAARVFTYARALALQDGKQHPTQKPVELFSWCLDQVPKAKTVCDPFLGSGTSAISCIRRGLTFVGIEREQGYFDGACKRIEAALKQPDMFIAPPKPAQQLTFDTGDAA